MIQKVPPGQRFGEVLKSAIRETALSREALAGRLNCSHDAVDNWCCGRTLISPARLQELCSLLSTLGVNPKSIRQVYDEALRAYGFSPSWPPGESKAEKVTLCILGSQYYRKELSILKMVSDHLSIGGHKTLIFHCGDRIEALMSCLDLAYDIGMADVFLCGVTAPPDIYSLILDRLEKQDITAIFIRTDCPEKVVQAYGNAHAVTWSDYTLAYSATRELINAGHKRIGTVYLEKHKGRFEGYRQALRDAGVELRPEAIIDRGTIASYPSITDRRFMNRLERFVREDRNTALFAPTELMTLAIPILLLKNGGRPGEDVSVCGLAYSGWLGEALSLPITYLRYPIDAVAHRVSSLVLRRSTGREHAPENRYIDVSGLATRVDAAKPGSIRQIA
ncbi:MAG: substrate-binding domain-containing protein [Chloroflexi bacterium]|nr:substrate-binding domain-containing protein [Chloroflexota bacterium]